MGLNENRVNFKSGELELEGLLALAGRRGAVLAHPHPLLGGNMRDHVLMAAAEAFNGAGISTLRFNFRGIGRSEGFFDNGKGEVQDLVSAVNFLRSIGHDEVLVAGYSFGAWVGCEAVAVENVSNLILISPPLLEMPFRFSRCRVGLAVAGDSDPLCPIKDLEVAAAAHGFGVAVVKGADHFYFGQARSLIEEIKSYLENQK